MTTDEPYLDLVTRYGSERVFPGQDGWYFLGGDVNSFLCWQFGRRWTIEERHRAHRILRKRQAVIAALGAQYHFFMIPEKSVMCQSLLPEPLASLPLNPFRPARTIRGTYLIDELAAGEAIGRTYEKGGAHLTGWGSYIAYRAIVSRLGLKPAPLEALAISEKVDQGELCKKIGVRLTDVMHTFAPRKPTAYPVVPPEGMTARFKRPFFIRRRDVDGPRAVIFRDSMSSDFVELLAEHFSRSVFVWQRHEIYADLIRAEKPDLVIHISTERFVSTLPTSQATHRLTEVSGRLARG